MTTKEGETIVEATATSSLFTKGKSTLTCRNTRQREWDKHKSHASSPQLSPCQAACRCAQR